MNVQDLIEKLGLVVLPNEGGHYVETHRSAEQIPAHCLPERYGHPKAFSTAIYYLLTPDTFSALHRLRMEEVYHFYAGDPVELLNLYPDGSHRFISFGSDVLAGQQPQVIVPKYTWQGCRLAAGGKFALMGTTVAPAFDYDDYEHGNRDELIRLYPECAELITALTREE